jgi:hypothetical protein
MSQAAGGAKNQGEIKRFDISNPNTFENFNKELITHVGMYCDGMIISAMREERLDYALHECVFESDYTVVASGRKYKGVELPEGLNYNEFREKYPLPIGMSEREKIEAKKKHDSYCSFVAKAIVIIEDKFEANTLAHFENIPEYTKARDSQDLIALIRQVRLIGPVGTVSTGAALVNWQSFVSRPEKTRYSLMEGCSGDFNEFATRWRGLYSTIRSLDKSQTFSEADHIRGVMRGLPDDDTLLSSIKANNLATPTFESMNCALRHLHDTITQSNRDVGNCIQISFKRKIENSDQIAKPASEAVTETSEILKILKSIQSNSAVPDEICRRYKRLGACSYEKEMGRECRFEHPGKNSKQDGVITRGEAVKKKARGASA